MKRKIGSDNNERGASKRTRTEAENSGKESGLLPYGPQKNSGDIGDSLNSSESKVKVRRLVPPRPFPIVPTSESASGPASSHKEGQNYICVSRKTTLATYLSRCKKLLIDKRYNEVHLHALGAAIPHLLMLAVSLPPILPFSQDEIQIEVRTGTVQLIDEVIPDDDDVDITMRNRGKASASVIVRVPDSAGGKLGKASHSTQPVRTPRIVIIQEEQMDEDE
ncbi:hypothetical protein M422DRAFT_786357 [Sphaerobolus stellatus SS14]|uniref:Unplaced genomic scaffold SPHSTscaffold_900, whole genome shotgun sequence n=1 Tax=Sphaerobolus stellatus (strain SS14) TaxID=990650 RepID=A0A0C9TLI3_SPHS4|nr:hypothetical protein M422DRAFT_786357 [Sphaerobolus stellatus SS14]